MSDLFNPEFHAVLEKQVTELEYGQITINVQLRDGKPIMDTFNSVKSRRKKYNCVQKLDTDR